MVIKIKYDNFPLTYNNTPDEIQSEFGITVDDHGYIPIELSGCKIGELKGHGGKIIFVDCYCPAQKDLRQSPYNGMNRFETYPIYVKTLIFI